nr:uncharacterized protein LOC100177951 [Ciona intestinalis]|eukprot:XP_018672647.1 uncharacterized protein LOC100177951 [Ciona intestinalis]
MLIRKKGDVILILIFLQLLYIFYLLTEGNIIYKKKSVLRSTIALKTDNCRKPHDMTNFTVCRTLPFTKVICEDPLIPRDYDEFGIHFKVPNSVHVIWFGEGLKFTFYNYLALRSMASLQRPKRIVFHYSIEKPSGPHWERAVREIPCLAFKKTDEPTSVLGIQLDQPIARTDAARIEILIKYGGIYIDLDVITLKNFDELRKYPVTMGRSVEVAFSMGILLAEKNSLLLREFYKEYPNHFGDNIYQHFTTRYIKKFYLNRPEVTNI